MPKNKTFTETNTDEANNVNVGLMLRVKAGGSDAETAFHELVELHQNAVIGTIAKMLGNPSEAEDIAQQVFIRLWKSASRYQVKAKFTTFLYTITRNLVFNETKRKQRKKEHSLEQQQEDSYTVIEDKNSQSPGEEILQAELKAKIDEAIMILPEKQRLAVIFRRYENMPYEEISDILELSVSAVKSQLFRARNTLREHLNHYLNQS